MGQYNIRHGTSRRKSLLILSLDTTTREGSVAVVRDGVLLAQITGDARRTHGQRLPGDLHRALDAADARLSEVDLLAVGVGPGSFTGLRIGIATMQGLAFSRGLSVVPVSTLEALARDAAGEARPQARIAPWIDAHRGEVFATLYAPGLDDVLVPPSSATPFETLRLWKGAIGENDVLFAGDGAVRYSDTISSALGERATFQRPVPPLAAAIGRIAALQPERAVLPHAIVPLYVRRADAELARDRSMSR